MADPERLGEILARSRVGSPRKKKLRLEIVRTNWRSLAGERLAEHSAPTRLSRGVLTAVADDSSWAADLSMKSADLLKGIDRILGEGSVKRIRVQARRERGGEKAPEEVREPATERTAEEDVLGEKVSEELDRLEDGDVKKALERLVRAERAGKQSNRNG